MESVGLTYIGWTQGPETGEPLAGASPGAREVMGHQALVIPGWTGRLAGRGWGCGAEGPGVGESGCVCISPRAPDMVTKLGLRLELRFSSLSPHKPTCPFPRWP